MMKVKIVLIVFIVLGLSFTLFQVFIKDSPKMISQQDAEQIATKLYGGKVLNTTVDTEKDNYQISLENNQGIYNLYVNGQTEKVSDVRLIEKKEIALTVDEAKKNIENELNGRVQEIKQMDREGRPFVEAIVEKDQKYYQIEYDLNEKKIIANHEVKERVETPVISKQEAKDIALKQFEGEVTKISTVETSTGTHYKVTIDGQKADANVYVQGHTGVVSSISVNSKQDDDNDDEDEADEEDDDHDDEDENENEADEDDDD
ncbi:PepSY domain-containing protein [Peribacillus asahii]|uniref:PepSY domain-containing protein n=1 Tax=Peribacillus asahii TaxID=228899 RepID=UPI00207AD27B|nr:PepSY domain-containing protein [Peribacillus asahii]USK60267.1 PepSY domain-containing protein [Peribacillus asahii]